MERHPPTFPLCWLLLALASLIAGPASAGEWRAGADLLRARIYHTATLLPDGRVLVVGGETNPSEVYNPRTNDWTGHPGLPSPRGLHTASLLPDGRVLLVGGAQSLPWDPDFEPYAEAFIWDPQTWLWTPTAPLHTARASHTATVLPDGRVLVIGGSTGDGSATPMTSVRLNDAEIYDPATGLWTVVPAQMAHARASHAATMLEDGSILVTGGAKENIGAVERREAERFDPATGQWSPAGVMKDYRYYHTATRLHDGRVVVIGGYVEGSSQQAQVYDPYDHSWSYIPGGMPSPIYDHTATLMPDGRVLLTGGWSGSAFERRTLFFDPMAGASPFTPGPQLDTGRAAHTAVLLANGEVMVMGGATATDNTRKVELLDPAEASSTGIVEMQVARSAASRLHLVPLLDGGALAFGGGASAAERYDPRLGNWVLTGAPLVQRNHVAATVMLDGDVVLAGGESGGNALDSVERFRPSTGDFVAAAPMAQARSHHSISPRSNGRVVVAGGRNGATRLASVELYSPLSDTWASGPSMIEAREQHAAAWIGTDSMMVCGGIGSSGTAIASCEVWWSTTSSWTSFDALPGPRSGHTLSPLPSGALLVAGGSDAAGIPTASAAISGVGEWITVGPMNLARTGHTATVLPDGRVLVVGGYGASGLPVSAVEVFDPLSKTWTLLSSLHVDRANHAAVLLRDGHVMVAGGLITPSTSVIRIDLGRAPVPFAQPQLHSVPAVVNDAAFMIEGEGFRPPLEASGGSTVSSPSNLPVLQVQSLVTGRSVYLPWNTTQPPTDTRYTTRSSALQQLGLGPAWLRLWVNGVPSRAAVVSHRSELAVSTAVLGDGHVSPSGTQFVSHGQILQFTVTPAPWHLIDGISGCPAGAPQAAGDGSFTVQVGPITASCSLLVRFQPVLYTLSYSAGPGGSVLGDTTQYVMHEGAGSEVLAVPDAGYGFVQWSDGSQANPRVDTGVTADVSVTAQFGILQYQVSASAGAGGSIAPSGVQTVTHGTTLQFVLMPDAGHRIDQVSGCGGTLKGGVYSTAPVSADCSVHAQFVALAGAGLSITLDNGRTTSEPGDLVTYRIVVSNGGPGAVAGARVTDVLPATLLAPMWTCSTSVGGSCAPAAGSAALSSAPPAIDLPEGGEATIELDAQVGAFDPVLSYRVQVVPPAGYVDPDAGDNEAVDVDQRRRVFRNGFE